MAQGAAWMVAIRWCVRGLDVATMLILARLLAPAEIGVYAVGILIVSLLELLTQAGIDIAIIRNPSAREEHYNTAWTIQIIQGGMVALGLFASAPFIADLFDEPRVTAVIRLLALRPLIVAFSNIGVVLFLKELDYRKDFWFGFYKKTAAVAVTLVLAFILRSYMAMVIGVIAGAIISVLLSYVLHPYRPRLSLAKAREIWSFSIWLLLYYTVEDLVEKADRFVIGAVSSTASLGVYQMASSGASMPLDNLIVPLWRALIPVYAKQAHDPARLLNDYLGVLGLIAIVSAAVAFGMAAVAEDLVRVLLGDQWMAAASVVQWLAFVPAISTCVDATLMILVVTGHARLCALNSCVRLLVVASALPAAGLLWGMEQVAMTYLAIVFVLAPVPYLLLARLLPLSARMILERLWRPVISGVVMFMVIKIVHHEGLDNAVLRLGLDVLIGALTYTAVHIGLWWIAGRPESAERTIMGYISHKTASRRAA